MDQKKVAVLSTIQINRKIERIAHQIIEFNYSEKQIVLVGIADQGYKLAEHINQKISENSDIDTLLLRLKMDKKNPLSDQYYFSDRTEALQNKSIILIDDVLNSGRTLIYAAREILKYPIKKLTTVVLVDRRHRKFPIKADFVGLTLSTTMQEHITVDLELGKEQAYIE